MYFFLMNLITSTKTDYIFKEKQRLINGLNMSNSDQWNILNIE